MNPRRSIRRAALIAISIAGFTLLGAMLDPLASLMHQAQSAPAAGSLDCPLPVDEGETWITRRWIDRGELHLECTHVAGFPVFDLPIARKVGLIP
jgi:hypothetical protein